MKDFKFWLALGLSFTLHVAGFMLFVVLWLTQASIVTPPVALLAYGDSSVEGMPIDVVSENPGTPLRGPDNPAPPSAALPEPAEKPKAEEKPPEKKADEKPTETDEKGEPDDELPPLPPKPEATPAPIEKPVMVDTRTKTVTQGIITSVASSSYLPLGTPSRGGRVGSLQGVRRADGVPSAPYPEEARVRRIEGKVIVLVTVTDKGTIAEAKLATSSGYAILDEAALAYCRTTLRFHPAHQDGVPVASSWKYPITYELTSTR
jgi:protein TonB